MLPRGLSQHQAMLCALTGFFAWVVVDAVIKLGGQAALSPFMIMAILGLVGAAGMVAVAVSRRNIAALRPKNMRGQLIVCSCSIAMSYGNVIALRYLSLTIYYIVVFVAPLAIAVLSTFMKHETLTLTKIACLLAGFVGVVIAISPSDWGSGEGLGYIATLINVAIFALSTVTMRRISQTDSVQSIQFLNSLSVGVVGVVGASLHTFVMPEIPALVIMIAAAGVNILGNVLYNKALKHTSSTNVAQLHYTQIVTGAILGYLIWHEVPTWNLVIGSIIIIASGMIVAAQAKRNDPVLVSMESVEPDVLSSSET